MVGTFTKTLSLSKRCSRYTNTTGNNIEGLAQVCAMLSNAAYHYPEKSFPHITNYIFNIKGVDDVIKKKGDGMLDKLAEPRKYTTTTDAADVAHENVKPEENKPSGDDIPLPENLSTDQIDQVIHEDQEKVENESIEVFKKKLKGWRGRNSEATAQTMALLANKGFHLSLRLFYNGHFLLSKAERNLYKAKFEKTIRLLRLNKDKYFALHKINPFNTSSTELEKTHNYLFADFYNVREEGENKDWVENPRFRIGDDINYVYIGTDLDLNLYVVYHKTHKKLFVIFRGTNDLKSIEEDMKFDKTMVKDEDLKSEYPPESWNSDLTGTIFTSEEWTKGDLGDKKTIHHGFFEQSKHMFKRVVEAMHFLTKEVEDKDKIDVIYTGHSLGGAHAYIFSYFITTNRDKITLPFLKAPKKVYVITWGSPRVGGATWYTAYMNLVKNGKIEHRRYKTDADGFTTSWGPPVIKGYKQIGYDKNNNINPKAKKKSIVCSKKSGFMRRKKYGALKCMEMIGQCTIRPTPPAFSHLSQASINMWGSMKTQGWNEVSRNNHLFVYSNPDTPNSLLTKNIVKLGAPVAPVSPDAPDAPVSPVNTRDSKKLSYAERMSLWPRWGGLSKRKYRKKRTLRKKNKKPRRTLRKKNKKSRRTLRKKNKKPRRTLRKRK